MRIKVLNQRNMGRGLKFLAEADPDMKKIWKRSGKPAISYRKPGFTTLVHLILEQQVSVASANATYAKLIDKMGKLTTSGFLTLTDAGLKKIGFSRQKTLYCRNLAVKINEGCFDPGAIEKMDDDEARDALVALKGIGPWTAEVYLLTALQRADVLPAGDLILANWIKNIKNLPRKPGTDEIEIIAETWRPWRSLAAKLLWHDYRTQKQ